MSEEKLENWQSSIEKLFEKLIEEVPNPYLIP